MRAKVKWMDKYVILLNYISRDEQWLNLAVDKFMQSRTATL
jgi:sRNA-binding regulator protein Hfq